MQHQLRIYTIKPGMMDEFMAGWREHVAPLRVKHGFSVERAWVNSAEGKSEFIWLVGYDGAEGYASADARYYASPDRANMTWDPMRYIERVELRVLDPVAVFITPGEK